ncbi:MAG TPA: cytochrome C oxidase subunit I, partial [Accumulibacter sp.]|nr:cytochrome C oxidase subunit I [Accumulibacter sp.]
VVGSLLFGKKLDGGKTSNLPTPIPDQTQAASAVAHGQEHVGVPGTVVLALLLFVCFVLYYFVNWKYLSEVWLLS